MDAKVSSPNYATFLAKHGSKAVELDAAPVSVLQAKLREAIERVIDIDEFNAQIELEKADAAHRGLSSGRHRSNRRRVVTGFRNASRVSHVEWIGGHTAASRTLSTIERVITPYKKAYRASMDEQAEANI